jgi:hypothetical protein
VGAAFGFATVFFSNSGLLVTGGALMRKVGIPRSRGVEQAEIVTVKAP